MSISSSLSNALSGLTSSSRAAQVVSNNVANSLTEGFARRELQLSTRVVDGAGHGVQIDGVVRVVDQGILRDRRFADAALSYSEDKAAFLDDVSNLIGTPDLASSLSGRLREFESALITAVSRPDSDTRLNAVVVAGSDLAKSLNSASDGIQNARLEADRSIALQVDQLNAGLKQVEALNADISRLNGLGRDVSGLEDQRQQVIDSISSIVPVREVPRDDGKVSLYTEGGGILLDDSAVQIDFTQANLITADMTLAGGALSGLTINGQPVSTSGSYAPLSGGSLAAAFEIRDELAPAAQADLDAVARDLIERFEDPAVDPTNPAGAPGLFTDLGNALVIADEIGLAGRIEFSSAVDPAKGGNLSLLRDGLGATAQGPVGNAAQLQSYADALTTLKAPASGNQAGYGHTVHTLSASVSSRVAGDLVILERSASFAAAEQNSLREQELANGVDTDQEMQKLLLIEQSYAANARVIQTIDTLIQELLSI